MRETTQTFLKDEVKFEEVYAWASNGLISDQAYEEAVAAKTDQLINKYQTAMKGIKVSPATF